MTLKARFCTLSSFRSSECLQTEMPYSLVAGQLKKKCGQVQLKFGLIWNQVPEYSLLGTLNFLLAFLHAVADVISLHFTCPLAPGWRIGPQDLIFVFKALHGMASHYISDRIRRKSFPRSALRFNDLELLVMPRTECKTLGDRAFALAYHSMWNKLPKTIQGTKHFKKQLKHIYSQKPIPVMYVMQEN